MKLEEQKHCCTVCASKRRCSVCDSVTTLACSDCAIHLRATVYVCAKSECQDKHEQRCAAEIERLSKEIENLIWNLGGCDTIASGWSKPFDYNKEMARPALDSVSRLATKLEAAESKLSQLQLSNEEKAEQVIKYFIQIDDPNRERFKTEILAILNGGQQ